MAAPDDTHPEENQEPELHDALTRRRQRIKHRLERIEHQVADLTQEREKLLQQLGAADFLLSKRPDLPTQPADRGTHRTSTARSIDAALQVLETYGPMHYRDVAKEVSNMGITIIGKDPAATLLSRFYKDPRFERTSSGTYRAAGNA